MGTLRGMGIGVGLLAGLGAIPAAHAGAFLIRSQSAAGYGMALAGVAAGDRLSYSFWNPAVLATIDDFQVESVATGILPSLDISPDDMTNAIVGAIGGTSTGSTDVGKAALVPAAYAAYPITGQLTAGVAVTSPFGLATESPDNWAGQVYSRSSEIFSLNVNPMLSYRINDMISVGAGAQFQYFRADLDQAAGVAPGAPDASLRADDIGVGFNLGIQIRPWEGTSVGVGYRSSIAHDVEGRLALPGNRIPAQADMDTPDVLSVGVIQALTKSVRLLGTVEWDNWSRLGDVPVIGPNGAQLTSLPLNYRDGWLYSVGAEYDATDRLTVRAGLGFETAPLTTANRDTRLPEVDQFIVSTGASYRYSDRVSLDVSYLYSTGVEDGDIDIGPDNAKYVGLPFHASSDLDVSIVSAALNVKFGGGAR